jgi:predicted outer membrane repeat protein
MAFQVSFISNVFNGNTAYYGGAIYSTNQLVGFSFSGNTLSQNSAYDGGALYKKSTRTIQS